MNLEQEVFELALNDIMPNRFQPREIFDDSALTELSQSIKEHGVIQPIIVRKIGDKYEIIAGERRFRASQLAGKETIPALIRNMDDKEAAKVALLENLQRKDLTPIEEAKTYQTILKLDNMTQEELAESLGKSQSAIANKLRLLNLSDEVQTALLNEKISERHARSLLTVESPDMQKDLLNKILTQRLTVRQLDEEITRLTGKTVTDEEIVSEINNQEMTINQIKEEKQDEITNFEKNINEETDIEPKIENLIKEEQPGVINFDDINKNKIFDFNNLKVEEPAKEENINYNIFETLRINENKEQSNDNFNYNDIYDLRFAINNFRQAIQNTQKFGFKIESEEKDLDNIYEITIKIEKDK